LDTDVLRWLLDRTPSRKMITELYELRLTIQPSAARLAARACDRRILAVINDVLSAEGAVQDGALRWPADFDLAILRATQNRWFAQMTELISGASRLTDRFTIGDPDFAVLNAQYLSAVAHGIRDANPDVAECNMHNLIASERQLVLPKLPP
jgi:GntR family galactonate operon transcriptional repressor